VPVEGLRAPVDGLVLPVEGTHGGRIKNVGARGGQECPSDVCGGRWTKVMFKSVKVWHGVTA